MCGVRFPLPLFVAVMMGCSWSQVLAANAWKPGENAPEKVNRLDSDKDPPVKVTVYNPHPSPTKLFASCIVSHRAYVRFRELDFPAKHVVFTRYVPVAAQLELYSNSWRVVNNSSLKTSLACASYAEQNASVMMYQFNGTKCRVSTARMPMKTETCGNKKATAVFIKTSCPDPTVEVTLTPAPGAMDISWTTDDPCNLTVKFQIDWVNVGGSNVTKVNGDVFQYRIYDRLGCETQTVTVTALDSFSQPYGNPTAKANDTLPRGPPKMTNLKTVKSVDHIDVTWSIADDECLRINDFVLEWKNVTSYSGSKTLSKSTYGYNITELHACITMAISVKARYDAGAGTTNVLSNSTETLYEDPVIKTFVVQQVTHERIIVIWTIQDYCNSIQDLHMIAGGFTYDISKENRWMMFYNLRCDTHLTFQLLPINGDGVEFASRKSLMAATTNPDPHFDDAVIWIWPPGSNSDLPMSWGVVDNECNYITGYRISYGAGQTKIVSAKTATTATITGYNACDNTSVTIYMLKGTVVIDSLSNTRPVALLKTGEVKLGFRKAVISWTAEDDCSSIDHYNVTYLGSEVITTDRTESATIRNQEQCQTLPVSIDGVDSNGRSVVQGKISATPVTTKNCSATALAMDVCYGCLHYLTTLPKRNKEDAATNCTASGYKLYRPADAAEVADLIAFLVAKLVLASDNADFRLYVDLTYASSNWTWGGTADVDETTSSNWAGGHPDSTIGGCAILSGGDGFKLKSVDCTSLQFAMCIQYITP